MQTLEISEQESQKYQLDKSSYKKLKRELEIVEGEIHKIKSSFNLKALEFLLFFLFSYLLIFLFYLLPAKTFGNLESGIFLIITMFYFLVSPWLIIYCLAYFFQGNFTKNIISFGRYNKLIKQKDEVNLSIQKTHTSLKPFEKIIADYFDEKIEKFFLDNLYKKRSGSTEFEERLSDFAKLIDEISNLNSNLITTNIYIAKYKEYLRKRTIDRSLQTTREDKDVILTRNFLQDKSIVRNQASEKYENNLKENNPPELVYNRTPRKIDNWEEINKKRKLTGLKGEEIVVVIEQEFLESIDRKDLSDKVCHVSKTVGDGLGYDVLSFFENGKEKYIEVKSTTNTVFSPYNISRNELNFLKEHPQDAFIYRVSFYNKVPQIKTYSGSEIFENSDITPVSFIVKIK